MKNKILLIMFMLAAMTSVSYGQIGYLVVASCPTGATLYSSGQFMAPTIDIHGVICTSASGGGGGGLSVTDQAAFTAGSSSFTPSGGFFQTTATNNPLTNGQSGMFQMTATRAVFNNLRNASGVEIGTAGAPLRVDPTGSTTQPVSGTLTVNAGTNLNTSALALDATLSGLLLTNGAAIGSSKGPLSFAEALASNPSWSNGLVYPLTTDLNGGLRVSIIAGAGSGGTALADNAAFTANTTSITPAGGFYHATRDSATDGHVGAFAMNINRAQFIQLEDSSKNEIGTAAHPVFVDVHTISAAATGPLAGSASDSVYTTGGDNSPTTQVSVGSTATSIVAARTARRMVCVKIGPTAVQDVFIGASGVTTSTGDYIKAISGNGMCYQTNAALYGITGSSTQTVTVVEIY